MKKITAIFAALAMLLFGAASVSASSGYVGGDVTVSNVNTATVSNVVSATANTGSNTANGGNGAAAGEGGNAFGYGLNIGGKGGNGGNGGNGGLIVTGAASAVALIANDVNSNITDISVTDCGCDPVYNIFYSKKDLLSSWTKDTSTEGGKGWWKRGDDTSSTDSEATLSTETEKVFEKTAVPVKQGDVTVSNVNSVGVSNVASVAADTGVNVADGGDAGKGEDGGSAEGAAQQQYQQYHGKNHHGSSSDTTQENIAGDAGKGGNGATGGTIMTGESTSLTDIKNMINRTLTSIVRN